MIKGCNSFMVKISVIAEMLNISKPTVYRKIEKLKLQKNVKVINGVRYIDSKGLEILKQKTNNEIIISPDEKKSLSDKENVIHEKESLTVNMEIEHLKRELKAKDEHIATLKNETILLHETLKHEQETLRNEQEAGKDLRKLIENSQVLLRQQQDKIFLLESPQDTPIKEKKSIWDIFKRN